MKYHLALVACLFTVALFGQNLYAPGTNPDDRVGKSTNNFIGIGTSSPRYALEVTDAVSGGALLQNTSSTNYTTLRLFNNINNPFNALEIDYSGSNYAGSLLNFGPAGQSGAIVTTGAFPLAIGTNNTAYMTITPTGKIGIATTTPDELLSVNGSIHAKEIRVTTAVPGPDYVFEKSYDLPSLEEVKSYIEQNKHLPEIPSANEMDANGVKVGEMNLLLLKKVEELTLYMIEMKEAADKDHATINELKAELSKLRK